jgi:hypothetical protein
MFEVIIKKIKVSSRWYRNFDTTGAREPLIQMI